MNDLTVSDRIPDHQIFGLLQQGMTVGYIAGYTGMAPMAIVAAYDRVAERAGKPKLLAQIPCASSRRW